MPNLKIRDYSGGINLAVRDDLIADNEAIDIYNLDTSNIGTIKQAQQFNITLTEDDLIRISDPPDEITNFICYRDNEDRRILCSSRRNLYVFYIQKQEEQGEFVYRYSFREMHRFNQNLDFKFFKIKGYIYILTDKLQPYKYEMETGKVSKVGMKKPEKPTCELAGGGGLLKGEYRYQVTFYNKKTGFESAASYDSDKITADNHAIKVYIPVCTEDDIGEPTDIYRKLYRIGGTLTEWYLVTTIENNTSEWVIDNTPDNDLKVIFLEIENDPPPRLSNVKQYKGFLIGVIDGGIFGETEPWTKKKNLVVLSNPGEIEGFRYDDDLKIYKDIYIVGDDSPIKSIEIFQDNIFIFKENSIYQMLLGDEGVASIRLITDKVGTISHKTTFKSENLLGTLDNTGIYLFDGSGFTSISDKIKPLFEKKEIRDDVSTYFYDNKLYISMPNLKTEHTTVIPIREIDRTLIDEVKEIAKFPLLSPSRILVFDFKTKMWTFLPYKSYSLSSFDDLGDSQFADNNLLIMLTSIQKVPIERYIRIYSKGEAVFSKGSRMVLATGGADWEEVNFGGKISYIQLRGSEKKYQIEITIDNTTLLLKNEYEENDITGEYDILQKDYLIEDFYNFRFLNEKTFRDDNYFYIIKDKQFTDGFEKEIEKVDSIFTYISKAFDFGENFLYKRLKTIELFGSRTGEPFYFFLIIDDLFYDLYKIDFLAYTRKRFLFKDLTFRTLKVGILGKSKQEIHIEDILFEFDMLSPKYRKQIPGLQRGSLPEDELEREREMIIRDLIAKGLVYFPPQGGWRWSY